MSEFLREARDHRARQQHEHRALEKKNRRRRDREAMLAIERFAKMNSVNVVLPPIDLMGPSPEAAMSDADVLDAAMDAVRQAAVSATSMSNGPSDGLARIFRDFDEDDSGSLSQSEFKNALNALGVNLTRQQLDTLMLHFDPDNSGPQTQTERAARGTERD